MSSISEKSTKIMQTSGDDGLKMMESELNETSK